MRGWVFAFAGMACAGPRGSAAVCGPQNDVVVEVEGPQIRIDGGACGRLTLHAHVFGEGEVDVSFVAEDGVLTPTLHGAGRASALWLEGDVSLEGDTPLSWWRQGYQSWSWSGVLDLAAQEAPVRAPEGFAPAAGDRDGMSVTDEIARTSWWAGLLGRAGGASVLAGALRADTSRWSMTADDGGIELLWHWPEGLALAGDRELEPAWFGLGRDAWGLWSSLGAQIAAEAGVETPARGVRGWGSWNVFYEGVTEAQVRENASELRQGGVSWQGAVVEIDDGWERVWGDWTANEAFPSGMDTLAADLARDGFVPGLWMAPLYVDRSTSTYQDHPDWWVKTLDGSAEIRFTNAGTGDYALLDTTVPDARAWMVQAVRAKVAAGYRFLKLDFLYAAAQVGRRHADVTGMEAYADAIAALREASSGANFLACGAPWLPSVGFVDGLRTGADIAFGIAPDPDLAFIRWQARQTAARGALGAYLWTNDPDVVLVRPPLDAAGRRASLVASLLAGGNWLLGDDLASLDADVQAALLRDDLARWRGEPWRPRDPLACTSGFDSSPLGEKIRPDDCVPVLWDGPQGAVAILNLGAEPVEVSVPEGRGALTSKRYGTGSVMLAPGDADVILPDGEA